MKKTYQITGFTSAKEIRCSFCHNIAYKYYEPHGKFIGCATMQDQRIFCPGYWEFNELKDK